MDQGNFDDFPLLRMHEMPEVEVHIASSADSPTGIGESAVPIIAPAVANAFLRQRAGESADCLCILECFDPVQFFQQASFRNCSWDM